MNSSRIRLSMIPLAFLASTLFHPVLFHPALLAETSSDIDPRTTQSERIVVTAQRHEVPAEAVGNTVTVITAEEIEQRRKTTVAELLRTVPGLEVVASGGSGQVTSVFLRGGNSSHTLVLIDNVRVNSTTAGAFDFSDLMTDQIERIEIVRGPLSSLYGSEAMAGVINITTRRGAPGFRVNGLVEAGSENHQRYQVGVDGASQRFDYNFSYSDLSTDAVSAALAGVEDDPHENTTFAGRLGFGFAGDGRVDVSARAFQGDVAIDGFDFVLGPVDDLDRIQQRDGLTGSVQVQKQLGRRVQQTFLLGFHDDELVGRDPNNVFSNFVIDSRSTEFTSQSDVSVNQNNLLTLGFSYEEREGESVGNFDEKVDIQSFFVQNASSWGERFHLALGARRDDHSQFGDETTFRAAAAWKLSPSTRLHGSFGTGFKAPTLVDLYFPFFSNPDLVPETSQSYDIGIEHKVGETVVFDVTWFDTDFEDLIVFDFATFLPQNIGTAESSGVELSFNYRPGTRFGLAASYTWNETEDLASGLQLARRPENRAVLSLDFNPSERWRGSVTLISVADRIDSDGTVLDDYERVDLTAQYRLGQRYEAYVRVENLFDEEYEEVNLFTSPGSRATVGLALKY